MQETASPPAPARSLEKPAPEPPQTETEQPGVVPAAFAPPFPVSAKDGDGHWSAIPLRLDQAASTPPLLHRTIVHPHQRSPFKVMEVVAMDLTRLRVAWAIGKDDEGVEKFEGKAPIGKVPLPLQERTLAVFNGGFMARHGRWGIWSSGVEHQPQKPEGCSIVLGKDGSLVLGQWSELEGHVEDLAETIRQTPPCLLSNGAVHPDLLSGKSRRWAGANKSRKTRRRSALGINKEGTLLYYALGIETEAVDLARGLKAIGAHTALQLDINWYWTRFLLAGPTPDGTRVIEPLTEGMEFTKKEYFDWRSKRDFFFVTLKSPSPISGQNADTSK